MFVFQIPSSYWSLCLSYYDLQMSGYNLANLLTLWSRLDFNKRAFSHIQKNVNKEIKKNILDLCVKRVWIGISWSMLRIIWNYIFMFSNTSSIQTMLQLKKKNVIIQIFEKTIYNYQTITTNRTLCCRSISYTVTTCWIKTK